MKIKRLKELIENVDGECEIFIRNSVNPIGNIQEAEQVELSTYGFFGESIPCVILNTNSSKEIELNENEEVIDFIKTI